MSDEGDKSIEPYPQKDSRSFGYEVARTTLDAAASMIPGGSYAVGKIVETVVAAPLQKRRDEWFIRVGEAINELHHRTEAIDPQALAENEDFITAIFEATQCAMKTKSEEKLHALRNAVLNTASGVTLDDTLRGAFFSYIDRFTPAHLFVLGLLQDPSSSPEMVARAKTLMAGSQLGILREALPTDMLSEGALSRILADFNREGLADTGGMNAMATSGSFLAKRTTASGDAFLKFIADPLS